ncbi:Lipase domain containing protein [Aphelenchoides besseyi]|nr:Lipase domain containing protein [Aphelenchoides besseyi]KAI6219047.1 Lipase domain containing protein [Aphelenchoides besseyi]
MIVLLLTAIFTLSTALPYNETFARYMLPLSSASVLSNPQICLQNVYVNAQLIKRFEFLCDDSNVNTCSGYLALLKRDKTIAVVFRASTGNQVQYEEANNYLGPTFHKLGKVHRYFYRAFMTLWKGGMRKSFVSLARKYPNYKIHIQGHSLGAALSSLASAAIVLDKRFRNRTITHYNTGQPRVGDAKFAAAHSKLIPDFYRITHAGDTVTHRPDMNRGFIHHAKEIWYKNKMSPGSSYVVCKSECRGERNSWADHRLYFEIHIGDYGRAGCPKQTF